MNPQICQQAMETIGSGVSASLRAVDCAATATAETAFGRLFGTDGALLVALQILLTLYVAFFAFSLILGRSRLGVSTLTPKMITLGLVLTFATSWAAYQTYVWNLAVGAPNEIAGILMGTTGSATDIFAQKIDVVFGALVEASDEGAMDGATSAFSPPGLLWLGATLLLLGTVGVLATCKIALAILLALGPIFVVMALFRATRGLFTGWLKGVVMLAFTPLFAVLGGTLMLELSVPVVRKLTEMPGAIDPAAAMAFFMIGAVHMALMVIVLKVAGTMVSGWTVFGLTGSVALEGDTRSAGGYAASNAAPLPAPMLADQARAAAPGASREIRLARAAPLAANDAGPAAAGAGQRQVRIVAAGAPSAGAPAAGSSPLSRTRGIGSRFRAAPARSMEKLR
ncbi:MAG TPA: type IV secretion system protein [Croceibacterium sp.]